VQKFHLFIWFHLFKSYLPKIANKIRLLRCISQVKLLFGFFQLVSGQIDAQNFLSLIRKNINSNFPFFKTLKIILFYDS